MSSKLSVEEVLANLEPPRLAVTLSNQAHQLRKLGQPRPTLRGLRPSPSSPRPASNAGERL